MAIESIEEGYSTSDTSVDIVCIEDGVERTVTINTVMSNGTVDFNATEAAIKTAIYGDEEPLSITPIEIEE